MIRKTGGINKKQTKEAFFYFYVIFECNKWFLIFVLNFHLKHFIIFIISLFRITQICHKKKQNKKINFYMKI